MTRTVFLLALLVFSAFSCSKEKDQVTPLEEFPAIVTQVEAPETAIVGSTVPIKVYFRVNNGCGEFNFFEVDEPGYAIHTIKVFPKYREGFCTLDLPTREVTYEFKPTNPGTYTLKFFAGFPEEYIIKAIVVNPES